MQYHELNFKKPQESSTYKEDSLYVVHQMDGILHERISSNQNRIVINTNLKRGLPLENINKLAAPVIEAWAFEVFENIRETDADFHLINVEAQERLDMADIILQFRREERTLTANTDVKATCDDIANSGKSPNITSYARIRSAYVKDPNYIFVILSIRHTVYPRQNEESGMMDWIIEISDYHAYDLKYISENDISYNPALGTGQIQIKDIHYVSFEERSTWQMCQLLDKKFLNSTKRSFEDFLKLARKYKWIKE